MDINNISSSIPSINPVSGQSQSVGSSQQVAGKSFQQTLTDLNESQNSSDGLLQQLAAGENLDIHQAIIATEETDINFRVSMAIRDRLVDAYREVMRMSV